MFLKISCNEEKKTFCEADFSFHEDFSQEGCASLPVEDSLGRHTCSLEGSIGAPVPRHEWELLLVALHLRSGVFQVCTFYLPEHQWVISLGNRLELTEPDRKQR